VEVRTSRTILLWLAVVFLGGIAVLAVTGDAEARRELPAQLAAWTTIAAISFAGWWFRCGLGAISIAPRPPGSV